MLDFLKSPALRSILDNPRIFVFVRKILAGNQMITHRKIVDALGTKHNKVLDLCCGTGDFATDISSAFYVGVDLNAAFINYANSRFGNKKDVAFFIADAMHTGLAAKSFSHSMLISCLHHFPDEICLGLLQEARRVTRNRIVIVDLVWDTRDPVKRFFIGLDRGDYVRMMRDAQSLIEQVVPVDYATRFTSRLAVQALFVCNLG